MCRNCHKLTHLHGYGDLYIPHEIMEILFNREKQSSVLTPELKQFKKVIELGDIIRKGIIGSGRPVDYFKELDKAG